MSVVQGSHGCRTTHTLRSVQTDPAANVVPLAVFMERVTQGSVVVPHSDGGVGLPQIWWGSRTVSHQ